MKPTLFFIFASLLSASAQEFGSFLHTFRNEVDNSQSVFELSISESGPLQEFISQEIAAIEGLEEMKLNTFLNEQDMESFLDELFVTPYVIPHFCYNLKGLGPKQVWSMDIDRIGTDCRLRVAKLLRALQDGTLMLRSFSLKGSNKKNDFHKIKFMAEDPREGYSLIISFDVVID